MKPPLVAKANTTKWMLRGLLFIPILMLTDYFYRIQRGTGSTLETVLMVCMIISVIGVLQLPVGLHAWLKYRMIDNE